MEYQNRLNVKNRNEFRKWLLQNSSKEKECYVEIKRGKPLDSNVFYYLDAVEEALCFGWIDSVWKNVNGVMLTKFTPRKKHSPWTELNKERCRRLIRLGLMTKEGEKVLPDLDIDHFEIDKDVKKALQKEGVLNTFNSFPPLYQRVRSYNVAFYKNKNKEQYKTSLKHLIEMTKENKMYGEWNDYGRLL